MKKTRKASGVKKAVKKKASPKAPRVKATGARAAKVSGTAALTKASLASELEKLTNKFKKLETATKEQKKKLKDLSLVTDAFKSTGQALVIANRNARIIEMNTAFQKMCRYTNDELTGKSIMQLWSESNEKNLAADIRDSIHKNGKWQGEVIGRRKNGEAFPVWVQISAVSTQNGKGDTYAATALEISAIKQNEQRLEHMAYYDGLTGLPNRTLVQDRLKHSLTMAQRHSYPVGIIYLDLDRFKEINDTLGHNVGDQLLVETARRIKEHVRESDTVSRIGGDEFLILLPEIGNAQNAANLSQKILDTLSKPFLLANHEMFISASLGISLYPADSENAETLISNADTAMYHAKAQGKNNYKFFTEDINKSTVQRFMLETRFRRALDKLEFQLNYQPKIQMSTGKICGMEALLRWYHPEQGNIKPSLFIPLAEETGLVLPLGEWALREACRQNKEWQDEGLRPIRVSVNISARQFMKEGLLDVVRDTLYETGLPPENLMLEITETAIIEDFEKTIQILKSFRKMGVGVSIDDFGTGYSSLNYLNRFSIDELKIDQSFIADIDKADNRKVVNAIIALAHSLNHEVVAEGVENAEQLSILKESTCDELQGYYFSMPLSAEDFHKLLKEDKTFVI